jgi:hypothetical protein
MFNHELWQRVVVVVKDLERTKPAGGAAIN